MHPSLYIAQRSLLYYSCSLQDLLQHANMLLANAIIFMSQVCILSQVAAIAVALQRLCAVQQLLASGLKIMPLQRRNHAGGSSAVQCASSVMTMGGLCCTAPVSLLQLHRTVQ
jgi:hypothetical protein